MALSTMRKWMWGGAGEGTTGKDAMDTTEEGKDMSDEKHEPSGRRRGWMPWRRSPKPAPGNTEHDPFDQESTTTNAPLRVICDMQGTKGVLDNVSGEWVTGNGSSVTVAAGVVTFGEGSGRKEFDVRRTDISLAGAVLQLDQSTTSKLLWSDGEVWTRPGMAANGTRTEAVGASTTANGTSNEIVPSMLRVSCYEEPDIDGIYTRIPEEQFNDFPVWQYRRQRLYNSEGYWMFDTAVKMSQNLGVVSSSEPHNGLYPDAVQNWDYYSGVAGGQDGWTKCTLTTVSRCNESGAAPRRPISGVVRKAADAPPLLENGIRFRLEVFFVENEVVQEEKAIDDLVGRVVAGKATIDRMMSALCKKFDVAETDWIGCRCRGVTRYILEQFYEAYDPRHARMADGLLKRVDDGTFTLDNVLQKLCERWRLKGAVYEDWCGDFPMALREGYRSHATDDKEMNDHVVHKTVEITKKPGEPLDIVCSQDSLVLESVTPGGVGDKHGLGQLLGSRISEANGIQVNRWPELAAAVQGKDNVVFRFVTPSTNIKPILHKPGVSSASQLAQKMEENPLVRLEVLEERERMAVFNAERQFTVTTLLPTKLALTVGTVTSYHNDWVTCRGEIEEKAKNGKPPAADKLKALQRKTDVLEESLSHAEKAARTCKMPENLTRLIQSSRDALDRSKKADTAAQAGEKALLHVQKQLEKVEGELVKIEKKLSADTENEALRLQKEDLKVEEEKTQEQVEDLQERLLSLCEESPAYAWHFYTKESGKTKKEKKGKKEKRSKKEDDEPVVVQSAEQ